MEIVTDYAKKRFMKNKDELILNRRAALKDDNKEKYHDLAMQYLEQE